MFLYLTGNSKSSDVQVREEELKATNEYAARPMIGERYYEDEEVSENSENEHDKHRTFNI